MTNGRPPQTKFAATAVRGGRTRGFRLSTGAVVAMSAVGIVTAVIAALLAMMVQAPQSPFIATQRPVAIAASSI